MNDSTLFGLLERLAVAMEKVSDNLGTISSDLRDVNDSLGDLNVNAKKIAGNTWAAANPDLKKDGAAYK